VVLRRWVVAAGGVVLLVCTVVAFTAFDRDSQSASDTLRPFLVTAGPVWIVAILVARRMWSGKIRG
jgi:hypothetical protein